MLSSGGHFSAGKPNAYCSPPPLFSLATFLFYPSLANTRQTFSLLFFFPRRFSFLTFTPGASGCDLFSSRAGSSSSALSHSSFAFARGASLGGSGGKSVSNA